MRTHFIENFQSVILLHKATRRQQLNSNSSFYHFYESYLNYDFLQYHLLILCEGKNINKMPKFIIDVLQFVCYTIVYNKSG